MLQSSNNLNSTDPTLLFGSQVPLYKQRDVQEKPFQVVFKADPQHLLSLKH